ncbi:TlpA family protein disulfide reductase [Iamia sp. SCSIO 61187]|uniref:TlpA family protein disulfide reductase n=1 Tax=Iamia sp. SCSIO 61187 TaxID=2722752 RepID=UPI001C626D27|nr:TlpA disulfide reductase family protein [Iamia sp. SCSIO 61187]QYG91119.1 TlpA family protein disulfide reductase [Iamia sp. SCSIO 61187]
MAASDDRDDAPADEPADEATAPDGPDDDPDGSDAATTDPGRTAPGPGRRAARRGLDGRTLAVCALVALIAALLAGFVANRLTTDDTDEAAGLGTLTPAEDVPDIVLPRLGGGDDITISDYRGQPLVVNFWGSWCEPCVDEMPAFQRVHESLGDDVAFLGVNVNDTVEAATRLVDRTGVTYDLARDVDGALGRALDVTTFPTTVLVDADGTVVDVVRREVSAERLCEKINQSLLNQSLEECG